MTFRDLATRFAKRMGLARADMEPFLRWFFAELMDQLALGHTVSIPHFGSFRAIAVRPLKKVCNLRHIAMKGSEVVTAPRMKIQFRQFKTATRIISEHSAAGAVIRYSLGVGWRARMNEERKLRMAGELKKKRGQEEMVVRIPKGVTTIKIELAPEEESAKTEKKDGKQRLLG